MSPLFQRMAPQPENTLSIFRMICSAHWIEAAISFSVLGLPCGVAADSSGVGTMKNKADAIASVRELTETRANRRQVSGHSRTMHARSRRRFTALRPYSILIFFFGISSIVFAQKQLSWSRLNGLRAGQGIEVIDSSMKRHDGEFVMVTDELFTLKEHSSDVSIKRENVVRVSTSSGPRRRCGRGEQRSILPTADGRSDRVREDSRNKPCHIR